jgi:DNA-binding NarL/FixJ family response regulator
VTSAPPTSYSAAVTRAWRCHRGYGSGVGGNGCQSLLRRAGQPVPRRGRGSSAVPPELRAVGVTSREVDVLRMVGERLGNTEIGTRLFLSPRTVEKHVASLIAKTRRSDRRELAAYATRLFGR